MSLVNMVHWNKGKICVKDVSNTPTFIFAKASLKSKSPSTLNTASMVMQTGMQRMGSKHFLLSWNFLCHTHTQTLRVNKA